MTDNIVAHPRRSATTFSRERLADIVPDRTAPLIPGMLPRRGVAFIAGMSTGGKTFFALEIALRISRGEQIAGTPVLEAGVLYIAAEDAAGVRNRVAAWRSQHGDRGAFQLIPERPDLLDAQNRLELSQAIEEAAVEMRADGQPLGLVVLDTLAKATAGADHNTGKDMGPVMADLAALANRFSCLVLVIAHTGKDETKGISGWYGQFGAADGVIMVTRECDDGPRCATVEKLKNGQDGQRLAFRLKVVDLGENELGDPMTSCVVEFEDAPDRPAGKRSQKLGPPEHSVLKSLTYVIDHGNTVKAPPMPGVKAGTIAATMQDVRARAMTSGFADPDEKKNTVNARWSRAVLKLISLNRIRQEDDLVWPI